jgi:hypothetical protein
MSDSPLIAAVLTDAQRQTVEHFQALNVPASWFVGVADENGTVEVIAIGSDVQDEPFCAHDPTAVTKGTCECGAIWDPAGWGAWTNETGATANPEGFVWSFLIEQNGDCSTNEAVMGEWRSGIEC